MFSKRYDTFSVHLDKMLCSFSSSSSSRSSRLIQSQTKMALFLRKKLPSLSFLTTTTKKCTTTLNKLPSHLSAPALPLHNPSPPPKPSSSSSNFMAEYLVTSFGFSTERAARASKRISHTASPSKPDSVRHFLKHHGFTDPQIATLITNYPPILFGDPDRTMEPNLRAIRDMGFDDPDLRRLVVCNPQALQGSSVVPRIEFWRAFLDGDMKRLLLVLTRSPGLLAHDVERGIAPKIALMREYGLSRAGITTVVVRSKGFFRLSAASIESLLKRVEEFGFPRGSPMFALGLLSFYGIKSETLKAKMELYKSFGWSDEELVFAIQKFPFIIRLSEDNIRAKMTFLVQEAGCTLRYIAHHPPMIGYSLEKRLIPRYHVMQILKSNELLGAKPSFYTIVAFSEKNFLGRVILPHQDKFPRLLETYIAASAGKKSTLHT
ncbi:transcription termination factor MTERF8, chloroplastic-like isoform X2 [Iris pallida]|uniref:Transcription termination factor MTERF8, chloroplastic-like isoform X2 n=1 Tax=Iris pallida TaxID=29817 RepID=A0AAX6DTZ3_IRIPA|nr:transcription termination factor MTERF8, chloroplastic-like isoform X2 [Iris pallida]